MRTLYGVRCLSVVLCAAVLVHGQGSNKSQMTAQKAYSFMGLTLGQSKAEATAVIANQFEPNCKTDAPGLSGPGLEFCYFHVKDWGELERSPSFKLLLVDDKVAKITYSFDRNTYDAMVQSIVKKYGAPRSSRNVVVQNRMGATFRGKEYLWSNAVSQMEAKEYSTTLDKSVVDVEDLKLMREFEKRALNNGPKI